MAMDAIKKPPAVWSSRRQVNLHSGSGFTSSIPQNGGKRQNERIDTEPAVAGRTAEPGMAESLPVR